MHSREFNGRDTGSSQSLTRPRCLQYTAAVMSTPFQFSPPEPVFGGAAPGPAAPEQPPSSLPVFSMPVGASSASAAFLTGSSTPAFAPFTFGAQPVPSPVFASATTPQPHPQPNHTTTPALSEQRPTEGQAPMTDAESPIQALVSMGFSGILASQALAACDNSLERAVYWCLNRVSEPTAPASQSKLFSESSRAFEKKKERPREKKKRDSEMDGEEEENRGLRPSMFFVLLPPPRTLADLSRAPALPAFC